MHITRAYETLGSVREAFMESLIITPAVSFAFRVELSHS